jgi:hypothetical protein
MSDQEPELVPRFNPQPDPPKEMTTAQTLTSIFFEPGETFKALRTRPRFLIAGIITLLVFMAYYTTFVWRVGSETIARAQIESRQPDATPEQIDQALAMQNSPIIKAVTYVSFPVVFAIMFSAGAGLYLLGTMLMGKSLSFKQALSVWVYSTYPTTVVYVVVNILLLFLKSPADIDPTALNSGIARANPSILVDPKAQPMLATILGSFDLIQFYGLFLAAVGLKVLGKLSSGSAWAIVLGIWVVGLLFKIVMSLIMGTAF